MPLHAKLNVDDYYPWKEMFVWNDYHMKEFYGVLQQKKWLMPMVYGYITTINMQSASKAITVILISRRSRHFAGTRYLKRGLNEEGKCANFVETEQIVYCHSSRDDKPVVSSFIQARGSIPLFWS